MRSGPRRSRGRAPQGAAAPAAPAPGCPAACSLQQCGSTSLGAPLAAQLTFCISRREAKAAHTPGCTAKLFGLSSGRGVFVGCRAKGILLSFPFSIQPSFKTPALARGRSVVKRYKSEQRKTCFVFSRFALKQRNRKESQGEDTCFMLSQCSLFSK